MSDVNGTHRRAMQAASEAARLQEMQDNARAAFLTRVARAVAPILDALLDRDHDKVMVLSSILGHMAVRSKATLEQLQELMASQFKRQTELVGQAERLARQQAIQTE